MAALGDLLEEFWQPLIAYASRLLDDGDAADDVVQDVFVRVWTRRREWRTESVRAFLFALTRNAALDELRRRRSRIKLAWATGERRQPVARTPAELLEQNEIAARIHRAIQDLPCKRREVFDLVYLQGFSYREAAGIMGISVKTAENQMTSALRQLRNALRPLLEEPGSARAGPAPIALVRPAAEDPQEPVR